MRSLSLLIFATLCDLSFQAQGAGFQNPGHTRNPKYDPLGAVEVWRVGESRTVVFNTPWTEFSVELWQSVGAEHVNQTVQKALYQRDADLFLVVELPGQDLPKCFNWTVESYDLKLSDSNMFFFWLRDPSDASRSVTSPYFNMTTDPFASTTSKYLSYASLEVSPGTPTAPPARTTPTTTPIVPVNPPAQGGDGRVSLAVQVGIGVGISVGGICSFVCAAILCVHLRKKVSLKRSAKDSDQESVSSLPWPPTPKFAFAGSETWSLPKPPRSTSPLVKQVEQVEMPMGRPLQQTQTRASVVSDKKTKRYELDGLPRTASSVYSR
ncbi:hypothetical protein PG985_004796 [Apiospora marii]|uniref:uncharacterized protein n=1 Tax=Apiospora marii TaxID=335849 RepID=UPI00312E8F44